MISRRRGRTGSTLRSRRRANEESALSWNWNYTTAIIMILPDRPQSVPVPRGSASAPAGRRSARHQPARPVHSVWGHVQFLLLRLQDSFQVERQDLSLSAAGLRMHSTGSECSSKQPPCGYGLLFQRLFTGNCKPYRRSVGRFSTPCQYKPALFSSTSATSTGEIYRIRKCQTG